jgi:hypothetical protein
MSIAINKILNNQLLNKVLFTVMLLLSLLPIFAAPYFVSTDGPCHVQGAAIFKELLFNGNASHYAKYAEINTGVFTNWGSVVCLGFLQEFFNAVVAEKIFVILSVLIFSLGFAKCIYAIKKEFGLATALIPVVATNLILQYGFYNYYLGLALGWWAVYFFMNFIKNDSVRNLICLSVFSLLVFLCHPLSLVLSLILMCLFYFLCKWHNTDLITITSFKKLLQVGIALFPSVIMLLMFIVQHKSSSTVANDRAIELLWQNLCEGEVFQLFSKNENLYINIILYALSGLGIASFFTKLQNLKSIVLLFCAILICLVAYFYVPNELLEGGSLSLRIELFIYTLLVLLLCISCTKPIVQILPVFICIIAFVKLSLVRTVSAQEISAVVQHVHHLTKNIPEKKNIAYLRFASNVMNANWQAAADNQFLLTHTACNIGAQKKSIVPDNILLSTSYYPIKWKINCDIQKKPLLQFQGIEAVPPFIDIGSLNARLNIDYLIAYGVTADTFSDTNTHNMWQKILLQYEKVGHSDGGVWRLYKRR